MKINNIIDEKSVIVEPQTFFGSLSIIGVAILNFQYFLDDIWKAILPRSIQFSKFFRKQVLPQRNLEEEMQGIYRELC